MRTIARIVAVVVLALSLLATATRAEAGGAGRAVLLVAGEGPLAEGARKATKEWLEAHGWSLVDGGKRATKALECLVLGPAKCADAIAAVSVDRLWFVLLENGSPTEGLRIVMRAFARDGRLLGSELRYCERCRPEVLRARVEEALEVVDTIATRLTTASAVLRLQSTPPGARIEIDGETAGMTDTECPVLPGQHRVTLTLPGYETAVRDVLVEEGEHKEIAVPLSPRQQAENPTKPSNAKPRTSPLPYVVGGVGLAGVAGGVTLLLLDVDKLNGSGQQRARYRETTLSGSLVTAAGGVAIAAGVFLWFRAREAHRPAVAPTVAVSADSASLGIAGEF